MERSSYRSTGSKNFEQYNNSGNTSPNRLDKNDSYQNYDSDDNNSETENNKISTEDRLIKNYKTSSNPIILEGSLIKNHKKDYKRESPNEGINIECGGYYYAFTDECSENSKISGLIQLPDSINTNNGKRNAYIVLGVESKKNKINIGLINSGTGWRPFKERLIKKDMKVFNEYNNKNNKFIKIEVEVKKERQSIYQIVGSFIFYDSNKNQLDHKNITLDASEDLEYEGNKAKFSFFRCMSLVPLETVKDDIGDGTYISNGKISELYITKNNRAEPWGIDSNNIKYYYKVHPETVKVIADDFGETFSITHNA